MIRQMGSSDNNIIPLYANKVNCAFLLVKGKEKGYDSLLYLTIGPIVQVRYC